MSAARFETVPDSFEATARKNSVFEATVPPGPLGAFFGHDGVVLGVRDGSPITRVDE